MASGQDSPWLAVGVGSVAETAPTPSLPVQGTQRAPASEAVQRDQVRSIYRKALEKAGLRRLRFHDYADIGNHDLRHTFGTRAVEKAESIVELKEWMGHANVQTTMRYLHYKSKADAARRLSEAFAEETTPKEPQPTT
ncbi:MAG: tyrosine-type recombinase/integrase [Solirubrobacteraceae bacterium]